MLESKKRLAAATKARASVQIALRNVTAEIIKTGTSLIRVEELEYYTDAAPVAYASMDDYITGELHIPVSKAITWMNIARLYAELPKGAAREYYTLPYLHVKYLTTVTLEQATLIINAGCAGWGSARLYRVVKDILGDKQWRVRLSFDKDQLECLSRILSAAQKGAEASKAKNTKKSRAMVSRLLDMVQSAAERLGDEE